MKSTSIRSRLMHRVGKLSVSIMQSFKAVFLRWRAKRVFVAATIAVSLLRGAVTPSPRGGGGRGEHASALAGPVRTWSSSGQGAGRGARRKDGPCHQPLPSLHTCPAAQPREEELVSRCGLCGVTRTCSFP